MNDDHPTTPQRNPTVWIYAVVLSVGVVCSLAIVSVYEITRPMIAANQMAFRQSAILQVLPGSTTTATYQFDPANEQFTKHETSDPSTDVVYAGFGDDGKLVGIAIETSAMGYQDKIRLLYGYSPNEQAIIGIRVLESRETPGLGDRVETDEAYLSNFKSLDVSLNDDGSELSHAIEFVKPGLKTEPWQIDGITGATISSRAIADMLRDSTAKWMPHVQARLKDFKSEIKQRRERMAGNF
jgi:electron transport complex protein RnfG